MLINIRLIRSCLFGAYQQMLDLDSGETIPVQFAPEEAQNVKHGLLVPLYTRAPICQDYLSMLESQLDIVDGRGLSEYPRFKFDKEITDTVLIAFVDKAMHYFEEIEQMLWKDRESDSPKYDPSFPTFDEYFLNASLQIAKDWCSKVGIEWY